MKKSKRRNYSSEFQARVFLETIKQTKTIAQISAEYKIHASLVNKWKKRGMENIARIFDPGETPGKGKLDEHDVADLLRKIGDLTMENEYLKKNLI